MPATLILIRHGQSVWNLENLFTGWWDADLTVQGEAEARAGGRALADAGLLPDVVHTSLQTRAIRTANLALEELGRSWVPVHRSWRLNERHYGDLTGQDKKSVAAEHGEDQLKAWRRSYDTPPPPIKATNSFNPAADARYADLSPDVLPRSECLKDVVDRMLPYWYDSIVPDLRAGRVPLVAAHGNSLRGLVKHLDGISDDDISQLNLPTGVPIRYELDHDLRPIESLPVSDRYVGDKEAAAAAAAAVAHQAG